MKKLSDQIRELAEKAAAVGYIAHGIKISFSAPKPFSTEKKEPPTTREEKQPPTTTLTLEKNKKFEPNFQWIKYALHFKDEESNWFVYISPLQPWGENKDGGQYIATSDSVFGKEGEAAEGMDTETVKRRFRKYLEGPNLYPKGIPVSYINGEIGRAHV